MASSSKVLLIDNPSKLPLVPLKELMVFQGDFKSDPDPEALEKLMRSILDHHVFIAKAIFYEGGKIYTEDGHQTLKALIRLVDIGYNTCNVISYELIDGHMQESGRDFYTEIMIPCQMIVPRGSTPEERKKDAAKKLLQINSQYAKVNPRTTFFDELGFTFDELDMLIAQVEIPELHSMFGASVSSGFFGEDEEDSEEEVEGGIGSEREKFERDMSKYNNDNCLYPIVPRFSEKYDVILIVSENETDLAYLETALELRKEKSYQRVNRVGKSFVLSVKRFQELWEKKQK